ncbi:MAG: hypothetical protein ACXACP_03485 [Candidatus Hodarchaeales archaeon]|jgi:hypothetical protein
MGTEEKLNKWTNRITNNSTSLLMIAVVAYFITQIFGFYQTVDITTGDPIAHVYIFGSGNLTGVNFLELEGLLAQLLAFLWAFLWTIVRLFAGLSFAAVCFDESKNIWFRVVAVAALMLIIFGGLNIM